MISALAPGAQLDRIQQVTAVLFEARSFVELRRVLLRDLGRILGARRVTLAVPAEDRAELRLFTGVDGQSAAKDFDVLPLAAEAPLALAIREGQVIWRPDAVYLPLRVDGEVLGGVALAFAEEPPLADRSLYIDVMRQVALAFDRARLYEEAERERGRAQAAARAKDEFLAMLGHELRNPLAPILTALHLMRLRAPGVVEKERLAIERQVNHLVRLVDDLLDVSRITRGNVELKTARIELGEVVARAIETASPLLEQRRHNLSVSVPARGLAINGDSSRLTQVVANLLTNAAKYTEPGGQVSIVATREEGDVVLRVRDSGIGILPEMLPRIFDLFAQGRQSLDRSQGGLGLGLAIVRSLVAMHGGSVSVKSAGRGLGSEFTLRLPSASAEVATAEEAATNPAPVPEGHRILVVDDNEDAAELLALSLSESGYVTRVAHDGPAALRVAEDFAPEVALLDIGLPVMDGYELARRLRAPGTPPIRLIAITGYGQESDRAASRKAGFDAHLVKPVNPGDLEAIVQRMVDGGEVDGRAKLH